MPCEAGSRRRVQATAEGVTRMNHLDRAVSEPSPESRLFLATQIRGRWDPRLERREQKGWDEHAAFMEKLVAEGRSCSAGPVGDGTDALLVVEAPDDDAVYIMLGDDPWYGTILETAIVIPWDDLARRPRPRPVPTRRRAAP